ncbi:hypothetical protein OS493_027546 [Desmophyllum pertusum]|uniref:Costars domain-containing protein n=1 Tax=Desmophyllum pertusum TaxID=174260 RepID=A0A9W9ZY43_9CNID|nr:hypothetical protein OS493_027546 [Desmophyllum pertusum]
MFPDKTHLKARDMSSVIRRKTGRGTNRILLWVLLTGRIMNVEHEVKLLVQELKRLGSPNADGNITVTFGVLFNDDRCANIFEALVGTLKAAKRKKIVHYTGELLLQGVHDNVEIVLLQPDHE